MAETLATFRSMLARSVTVDEALSPYLGLTALQADRQAEALRTADGLLTGRLRALVTILALREAPAHLAMLVAALLWRSAPVATSVDELREAIVRISLWRSGLDDRDVARIVRAHREHSLASEALLRRTGSADGPEAEALLDELSRSSHGDDVVVELGSTLLVVEMTDTDYFVGLMDEDDVVYVIDRVPHSGWGGDRDDEADGGPVAPAPGLLQDA